MPRIPLWCLLAVCCLSVCDHPCAAQDATSTADADAIRIRVSVCSVRGEVTVPDDLADAGPLIEQLRNEGKIEWLDTTRCSILDGTSTKVAIGARRSVQRGGGANPQGRSPRPGSSARGGLPPGAGTSVVDVPSSAIDQAFERYDTDRNGELSESEIPKPRFDRPSGSIDLATELSKQSAPISKEKFAEALRQSIANRPPTVVNPQFGGFGNRPSTTTFESVLTGSSLMLTPEREADGSVAVKILFDSNQLEGLSAPHTAAVEEGESTETPAENRSPSATTASTSDMTAARTESVVKLTPGKVRVIRTSVSDQEHSGRSVLVFVALGSAK